MFRTLVKSPANTRCLGVTIWVVDVDDGQVLVVDGYLCDNVVSFWVADSFLNCCLMSVVNDLAVRVNWMEAPHHIVFQSQSFVQ